MRIRLFSKVSSYQGSFFAKLDFRTNDSLFVYEPIPDLVLHGLDHLVALLLADVLLDLDQRLLVLELVILLDLTTPLLDLQSKSLLKSSVCINP